MPAITQFVPVDLLNLPPFEAVADAAGTITVITDEVPTGQFWEIERLIVVCNSAVLVPAFTLYRSSISPINVRAGTFAGNFAIADNPPPLRIPSSIRVIGQWTGADVGAIGTLVIEGLLVQRIQIGTSSLTGA